VSDDFYYCPKCKAEGSTLELFVEQMVKDDKIIASFEFARLKNWSYCTECGEFFKTDTIKHDHVEYHKGRVVYD